MLFKALNLCYKAHKDEVDKAGKVYYLHPIAVALMCKTEEEKIVALLHDVIEDTSTTFDDLKQEEFSDEILKAIDCITKRESEEYNDYIIRVKTNPIARAVKINDLIHNSDLSRFENPTTADFKRRDKYKHYIEELTKNTF